MAETTIKRRPIRAALYGLMLGFSIWYFLQFQFATFGFDTIGGVATRAIIVIVATMALSVVWAYLAPARKPKGEPPVAVAEPVAPEPVAVVEEAQADQPDDPSPALPDDDE